MPVPSRILTAVSGQPGRSEDPVQLFRGVGFNALLGHSGRPHMQHGGIDRITFTVSPVGERTQRLEEATDVIIGKLGAIDQMSNLSAIVFGEGFDAARPEAFKRLTKPIKLRNGIVHEGTTPDKVRDTCNLSRHPSTPLMVDGGKVGGDNDILKSPQPDPLTSQALATPLTQAKRHHGEWLYEIVGTFGRYDPVPPP